MSRIFTPRLSAGLALLAAAWLPAHAQEGTRADEPIQTDRPDFVESSETVGKGRFQVETSFLAERERNAQERNRSYSMPTMLRFGLNDAFELRIESDGRTVQHTRDKESGARSTTAGYADTAIGFLWHALDGEGMRPSVGVVVGAELPTGSRRVRGVGVRPSLRVVGEWDLPGEMQLGVMPGLPSSASRASRKRGAPPMACSASCWENRSTGACAASSKSPCRTSHAAATAAPKPVSTSARPTC